VKAFIKSLRNGVCSWRIEAQRDRHRVPRVARDGEVLVAEVFVIALDRLHIGRAGHDPVAAMMRGPDDVRPFMQLGEGHLDALRPIAKRIEIEIDHEFVGDVVGLFGELGGHVQFPLEGAADQAARGAF